MFTQISFLYKMIEIERLNSYLSISFRGTQKSEMLYLKNKNLWYSLLFCWNHTTTGARLANTLKI